MALTILAGSFASSAHAAEEHAAEMAEILQTYVKDSKGPGCSIAVQRAGEGILTASAGVAELQFGHSITKDTRFNVASVTKQFTAAAVLLLVADGKLSLETDARTIIPELKAYPRPVSVDQLLTHSSGLPDYHGLVSFQGYRNDGQRQLLQPEAVALIGRQAKYDYEPGTRWAYVNSGYIMADEIVRRVSGMPTSAFLKTRIFDVLGMRQTALRDDYRIVSVGLASGYSKDGEGYTAVPPYSVHGSENLVTTPSDLMIWAQGLEKAALGALVTAKMRERFRTSDGSASDYGRGVYLRKYRGFDEIGHSGSTPGFTAFLGTYPTQKLTVAAACNSAMPTTTIVRKVADLFLGAPQGSRGAPPSTSQPYFASSASMSKNVVQYAGIFLDAKDGQILRFEFTNGLLHEPGLPAAQEMKNGVFRLPWGELTFDGVDKVRIAHRDGRVSKLHRISGKLPSEAELKRIAGRFYSPTLDTEYKVAVKDDGLEITLEKATVVYTRKLKAIGPRTFEFEDDIYQFGPDQKAKGPASLIITGSGVSRLEFRRR